MTGSAKLLKITCLAALFVGIASVVVGALSVMGNLADFDAWATVAEGVGSTIYGVRTAILANVPSNTAKIRMKAAAMFVLAVGVVVLLITRRTEVELAQLCLGVAICTLACVAVVVAHGIVKAQLRK